MFEAENPSEFTALDFVSIGRTMGRERRQNGWVEKRGKTPKKWVGFYYEYVKLDSGEEKRRIREKVLGPCSELTKGAAEDALRDLIRAKKTPLPTAKFKDLAAWYLRTKSPLWSKKWRGTATGFFENHIIPELGDRLAAEIKLSEVQQTINAISLKPGCQSLSMVEKILTQIRAVFESAVDDEILERNPARKAELPPTRKPSERFLTLEECRRLLEAAPQRDAIILRLFMVMGFRPGELFAFRVNDLGPGTIRVDQVVRDYKVEDGAKTEGSVATLPLPPALEAELRDYIRQAGITDLLFPSGTGVTPISPDNYLDRTLKNLGVLAGIDVFTDAKGKQDSKLNHQILRRTTGTHFQKHGQIKDTQGLLRHADARTTLKHYQKRLDESLVSGVDSWDAELIPRKGATVVDIEDAQLRRVN